MTRERQRKRPVLDETQRDEIAGDVGPVDELADELADQFVAEPGDDLVVSDPAGRRVFWFRELLERPYVLAGWFPSALDRAKSAQIDLSRFAPAGVTDRAECQRQVVRAALTEILTGGELFDP